MNTINPVKSNKSLLELRERAKFIVQKLTSPRKFNRYCRCCAYRERNGGVSPVDEHGNKIAHNPN